MRPPRADADRVVDEVGDRLAEQVLVDRHPRVRPDVRHQLYSRRGCLRRVGAHDVVGELGKVDQLATQGHVLVRVSQRAEARQHALHALGLGHAVGHRLLRRLAAVGAAEDREVGHDRRQGRRHLVRHIGQEPPLRGQHPVELLIRLRLRLDGAVHAVDHRQHDQGKRRGERRLDPQDRERDRACGESQRGRPRGRENLLKQRKVRPAAVQRRGQHGQPEVDEDVDSGTGRRPDVLNAVDVGSDGADHRRQRSRDQRVARVVKALRPRPADEKVAGQDAERRGGRPDPSRE